MVPYRSSVNNFPQTSKSSQAPQGKKFGIDAAPSGKAVAFIGGELCDYTFRYTAFPLWAK